MGKVESIPISAPAGDDVKLPGDIPVFPNSETVAKRITGNLNIFDFKVKSTVKEVNDYYIGELKKQGWALDQQMPNSADGLYFKKVGRTVRLITVNHIKDPIEYHLFVFDGNNRLASASTTQSEEDKKVASAVKMGGLSDLIKFPSTIPEDVPVYPNGKMVAPKRPNHKMFVTPDAVKTIASWYSDGLKKTGWKEYNDTSELGDSMVIYEKIAQDGTKRHVGVRVNDLKDQREYTLIFYPDNAVIPILKAPSVVAAQQSEAQRAIVEQQRKAEIEKEQARIKAELDARKDK
jgi:hypothetical protein